MLYFGKCFMGKIITLVPVQDAKKGYEFVHYGHAKECVNCKLFKVCIENLEAGRKYKIVSLRDYEHECKISGKVRVVEVEEADIRIAVDSKFAMPGAKIVVSKKPCNEIFCEYYTLCVPEGLKNGDACKIVDLLGKVRCPKNKSLVLVRVRRT